jgi:hypothetical protein
VARRLGPRGEPERAAGPDPLPKTMGGEARPLRRYSSIRKTLSTRAPGIEAESNSSLSAGTLHSSGETHPTSSPAIRTKVANPRVMVLRRANGGGDIGMMGSQLSGESHFENRFATIHMRTDSRELFPRA